MSRDSFIHLNAEFFGDTDIPFGTGFDSIGFSRKENLLTPIAQRSAQPRVPTERQSARCTIQYCNSKKEVNNALRIGFELQAKIINNTARITFGYESDFSNNQNTFYYLICVEAVRSIQDIPMDLEKLTEQARIAPTQQQEAHTLFQQYGDFYLKRKTFGGSFIILCEVSCQSEEEKSRVHASLEITANQIPSNLIANVSVSTMIEALKREKNSRTQVSFRIHQLGGDPTTIAQLYPLDQLSQPNIERTIRAFLTSLDAPENQALIGMDFASSRVETGWGLHFQQFMQDCYRHADPVINLAKDYHHILEIQAACETLTHTLVGNDHTCSVYLTNFKNRVTRLQQSAITYLTNQNNEFINQHWGNPNQPPFQNFDLSDHHPENDRDDLQTLLNAIQNKNYVEYGSIISLSQVSHLNLTSNNKIGYGGWGWDIYPRKKSDADAAEFKILPINTTNRFVYTGATIRLQLQYYGSASVDQLYLTNGVMWLYFGKPEPRHPEGHWSIETRLANTNNAILTDGASFYLTSIEKPMCSWGHARDETWTSYTKKDSNRVPLKLTLNRNSSTFNKEIRVLKNALKDSKLFRTELPAQRADPQALANAIASLPEPAQAAPGPRLFAPPAPAPPPNQNGAGFAP